MSNSLWLHGLAHGIIQVRILEWVALPFSRGSSQPRDRTQVSHIAGGFFTGWATREPKSQREVGPEWDLWGWIAFVQVGHKRKWEWKGVAKSVRGTECRSRSFNWYCGWKQRWEIRLRSLCIFFGRQQSMIKGFWHDLGRVWEDSSWDKFQDAKDR